MLDKTDTETMYAFRLEFSDFLIVCAPHDASGHAISHPKKPRVIFGTGNLGRRVQENRGTGEQGNNGTEEQGNKGTRGQRNRETIEQGMPVVRTNGRT